VNAILIRMRELSVQAASDTVNDANRESINAEYVQLISEIDRIATVTSYNNSTLLSGYGNSVTLSGSTSITSSNTSGVRGVAITGAAAGTYTFVDAASNDNQITLGNGIETQTFDIGAALDNDGSGVVATGSSIVANFDRLGIQLTLSGQRPGDDVFPATDGYRDGDLNGLNLVINSGTGGTFQIGPDDGAVHRYEVTIRDMAASGKTLNLGSTGISTLSSAQTAITSVDYAITQVAQQRGDLGAIQNRLAFTIRANETAVENVTASESTISDADIAAEVSAFTRSQILVQSGTALLAQANVLPQNALSLLG
jgi:flagellin